MKALGKIVLLMLVLQSSPLWADRQNNDIDNYDNPDSVEMALNEVPQRVLDAAMAAQPGVYLTRVVRDLEADDEVYYTFEGTQVRRYWIIVVRADGTLIKVREEEDRPHGRGD